MGRVRALVEADLGLVEEARASAQEGLDAAPALRQEIIVIFSPSECSAVSSSRSGTCEAAAACLRELPARLLASGYNDPAPPIWADTIETLVGLGELDRHARYLEQYEAKARRLGSPWVTDAARCRGLLAPRRATSPARSPRSTRH